MLDLAYRFPGKKKVRLRTSTVPGTATARRGGFLTRRLRHLIVVPYLVLATLLAAVITYLLASAANQSLTDRFNSQLLDAAQGGASGLVQVEDQQLQALRAIAFTQGFAEALAAGDKATLSTLALPQTFNYGLDRVEIVTKDGNVLISLPEQTGNEAASASATQALAAIIQPALHPSGDQDKLSAIISTDGAGGALFYTGGPVRLGDKGEIVGAVLVGSNLSSVLKQVARTGLSDGSALYGPSGDAVGYSTVASQGTDAVPTLPTGWYGEISARATSAVRVRTLVLNGETFVEALGVVPGRGLGTRPPGVYGVMLRTQALDANLQQTLWATLPVFGLGLALIVLIGIVLANWIDRPLTQLMIATGRVARGDLEVQVPVNRNDELGVLAARFNDMVGGLRQLLLVKDLFGRFVSPEVSAKLLAGQIELGGEQRDVTILFSDLRDFTALSEERSPAEIVELLNEYFRNVVSAARKHGGIVNKFGGDSTLIIFGAPVEVPDHADRALATALEMKDALRAMSERRQKAGWKALHQGIGINTGTVIAGQIGSEDRMEYTVIGDAVNTASRLQAMTKRIKGTDILLSESTLEALADPEAWQWENKGQTIVRGKQIAMSIYSLHGKRLDDGQTEQGVLAAPLGVTMEQLAKEPEVSLQTSGVSL